MFEFPPQESCTWVWITGGSGQGSTETRLQCGGFQRISRHRSRSGRQGCWEKVPKENGEVQRTDRPDIQGPGHFSRSRG